MNDLKEKTIRGGFARTGAQGIEFLLRLVGLMVLARLLSPKDFGIVGMATAFTGFLNLFRDFGLSSAAIHRAEVTEEQLATLFWLNVSVGGVLALTAIIMAPAISEFYHDPRLLGVMCALAIAFLFNAAGVQHSVILQRQMRFTAMAVIRVISLVIGTVVGILGAIVGYGYWSLVAASLTFPLVLTIGFWIATGWRPRRVREWSEVRSMVRFGGAVTLTSLVGYLGTNCEKILLGRFWGANMLGLYGRAYQLINIPTEGLNLSAGEVAFAALSRLRGDPNRLKSYFLKGYSLFLTMTLPVTAVCALFADDIITVFLGQEWISAAPLFRFLAPTVLVLAIIRPLDWLLPALGLVERSLKMVLVFTPMMIVGVVVALRFGPQGVALAYSTVMLLWAVPAILWAVEGTIVSARDLLGTASKPLLSSIAGAGVAVGVRSFCGNTGSTLARLILEITVLLTTYGGLILCVTEQKSLYLELFGGLRGSRYGPEQ
jgi:PST family polysaccharide transporter